MRDGEKMFTMKDIKGVKLGNKKTRSTAGAVLQCGL